jgi:hypothetical protein
MSAPPPTPPATRPAGPPPGPARGSWTTALARAALGLYPPAWRARYRDEVRALLDDSGAGLRSAASLAWRAAPAWVRPPRHLHDRPGRMQASLATVFLAWTALAGLAAVFAQLTQAQPTLQTGITGPRHLVIQWSYWVFDGAVLVSVLALIAGALPLWLGMLRTALPARRPREVAWLLAPVAGPALYLVATVVTARLVRRPAAYPVPPGQAGSVVRLADGGVGPWWFLALVVAGFAVGGLCAAGPGLAVRRLDLPGPAVTRAARAAGLAAVAMSLAGAASIAATAGLYQWALPDAGYHESWLLAVYLPAVLLAAAVAIISAARGIRAAGPPAAA